MEDVWNPAQYQRFASERAQPFHDLLALVQPGQRIRGVDLGCGSGELTALAAHQLHAASMTGIDSSPKMLALAAGVAGPLDPVDTPVDESSGEHLGGSLGEPVRGHGLRFERGDISVWTSDHDYDLVLANASLQWVPDHATVLARWAKALRPGGQLAVQVPANHDYPSHTVSVALAEEEPYRTWFAGHDVSDPVARNVLSPVQYSELLDRLGFAEQTVRLQVYGHHLRSAADVAEWVRGTSLTRFQKVLSAEQFEQFFEEYTRRLVSELGEQSPFFFPFKRILMWARLAVH